MFAFDWLLAHAALVSLVLGTILTVCLRLMASGAWEDVEHKVPWLATLIRVAAEILPDVVGAVNEIKAAKVPPPAPPSPPMFPPSLEELCAQLEPIQSLPKSDNDAA